MRPTIRIRLLLLITFATVLILSVLFFNAQSERNDAISQAMTDMSSHAHRIADEQTDAINYVRQIVTVIAELERLNSLPTGDACHKFLAGMIATNPRLGNVLIADIHGNVICNALITPKPINIADRQYFQQTLLTDQDVVGNALNSRSNQKWVLPVAKRLRGMSGGIQYVVVATLDLGWVNRELAKVMPEELGRIGLIDSEGIVLTRYPDTENRVGKSSAGSRFFADLRAHNGEGSAESLGFDHITRLYGFAPFAETLDRKIYLWVGINKNSIVGKITQNYIETITLVLVLFLLLITIIWFGSERLLLRPITQIANVTRRLGQGDYTARTQLPYQHDEIGILAESVDKMAVQLMSNSEVLRLNRSLNLLNKCAEVLMHTENESELLTKICQLCVESGGYVMAWVGFAEQDAVKTVRPVAKFGHEIGYLDLTLISWADDQYGRGPTGSAIRQGKTCVNQNYSINPAMSPWREAAAQRGYQASIALPLRDKQQTLGALTLYTTNANTFFPNEIELLESLANDLAFGIVSLRTQAKHDAAQQELAFLAHHDALTGLPNRILLCKRFEHAAELANQNQTQFAIFFLDIDNFKQINDGLGHGIGDQLLINVTTRLQQFILPTDTLSRQGGDEFIILLNNVPDLAVVEHFAQKIIDAFAEPFMINDFVLNATFSIGVSLYPKDGTSFDSLLKQADTALYRAKEADKNTYRLFSPQMSQDALEYIQIQRDLHNALENNEFSIHFQPKIDAKTECVVGAEALIRWQHPTHGFISPAKFIPIAERAGLIAPIGEWVLNESCRLVKRWEEQHQLPRITIAVNVSAQQFKRSNFVEVVVYALKQSGLAAHQLELELTESVLMHDLNIVKQILQNLKEFGIKLSIDDFGTGYSSLSYLKQLSVDKLKIDQSFVREMLNNQEDAEIVKAIVVLGCVLHLTTIAEGVETREQFLALQECGCDVIQGYYFSRPLTFDAFVKFFQARQA